ncbi:hypothetical protein [Paracoccus tegillarcae]|nr:hypothetical protein [Paracoccus tegillarcae]
MIIQGGIIVGSVTLMVFCVVLARRLRRLNDLEDGLGGAIAVMAAEIDRLEKSIHSARREATTASEALANQLQQAKAERDRWSLHLKMRDVVPQSPEGATTVRLRKRREPVDA